MRVDLRAVEGKQRRSGRAPLTKLTTHQRQVMQRLTDAHGDDVEVGAACAEKSAPVFPGRDSHPSRATGAGIRGLFGIVLGLDAANPQQHWKYFKG